MNRFPVRTLCLALVLSLGLLSCQRQDHPVTPTPVSSSDTSGKHIKDSLWAYYPVKGSVADSSGHNHLLTLLGGAALTYDAWGNDQEAINFNGSTNYAIITDGSLFPASDFSVSFFVMLRENRGLFFGKQDYSSARAASFNVGIDPVLAGPTTRFSITSNQASICSQVPSGGIIATNVNAFYSYAWYHVVITYSNGTMKLYTNGTLVATQTTPFQQITTCASGLFILGDWWSGGHNLMNGKMDELRIYTRAISASEVRYLFAQR